MREVIPGRLWLGNVGDACIENLSDAGICAVVDLALEAMPPVLPRTVVYCRFPIVDGRQSDRRCLRLAVETVASLLSREVPTLVFCGAGMSRSPSVVAAAWSLAHGGDPDHRLRQVVSGHPHDVSPPLWTAVREVCRESNVAARWPPR